MTDKDISRLRQLAYLQKELAESERNQQLKKDWILHGDLQAKSRPMFRIELWTFEDSILPPLMQCEDADARAIEKRLLSNIVNFELFEDDTMVPDHIGVSMRGWFVPFGLEVKKQETGGLGHHFIPYLADLEEDFEKLGPSPFGYDEEGERRETERLQELLGDILPVAPERFSIVCTPTQDIVHIMDMEDMFVAMYDAPELFHKMMDMLVGDYLRYFDMLEQTGRLRNGTTDQHLCQGSYCYTNRLTATEGPSRLKDMWLFMDSQETSSISPEMYGEFVFPYYKRVLDRFGLVSYGCCEAVHPIWDGYLSTVGNLTKVSISPWCDEEIMGERLKGRKTVYLRKPSPNLLGLAEPLDEDAVRQHFLHTAKCASGCKLELAQRDVYRVRSAEDVHRYIEIAREALETYVP